MVQEGASRSSFCYRSKKLTRVEELRGSVTKDSGESKEFSYVLKNKLA